MKRMKFKVITKYVLIALVLAVFVCCGSAAADNKFYVDTTGITEPIAYDSTITLPVMVTSTEGFAGFKVYVYNSDPNISVVLKQGNMAGMYTINNNDQSKLVATLANSVDSDAGTVVAFYIDVTPTSSAKEANINLEVVEVKKVSGDVTNSFTVEDKTLAVQKAPSIATSIEITSPVDETVLVYGTEGVATAVVYDQYGDEMKDAKITWTATADGESEYDLVTATGLTIDNTGAYKVVGCAENTVYINAESGDVCTCNVVKLVKAELTADDFVTTPELKSYEWTGQEMAVTVNAADSVTGIGAVTVSYNGGSDVPKDKGTYKVTISVAEGDNYNATTDLELGTLTITGTIIYAPTLGTFPTYNGEEQTIALVDSANSAGMYTVSGNTGTDAGKYTLTLNLTDKENAEWDNGGENGILTLIWEILPKSITGASVTTSTETDAFTYDGSVKTPTFIVTDGTMPIADTDYVIEGDLSSAAAGKHQVTIKGQNNYTGSINAEWNIAPAVPTIDDIAYNIPTGVVYGQTYEVTAEAKDNVFGLGEITLLYNGTASVPVNAGTYKVNASIAAGANYTAAEVALGDLVIAKAVPVAANITCVMEDVVYDGKAHALTAKAADGVAGLGTIKLLYNDTEAVPIAAGNYVVKANVSAGENYEEASVELGSFNITKAALTAADFTFTPALPVSYEEGGAEAVVVTLKEGILGNGTITVKYNDLEAVPTTEGIHKVNATFAEGTNYTAAEFYLGDMTIVKKVAPVFNIDFVVNPTNITINGTYTVDSDNTTIIVDNGVGLLIKFTDFVNDGSKIVGNISDVTAQYPEVAAASPLTGEFKYNLTINLGDNLTNSLPEITSIYNKTIADKVKPSGKTFKGLAMITAVGNVDEINAAIKSGKGNIKLTFKIPKSAVSADEKNKIVVYHVSGDKFTKASASAVTEEVDFYVITVTGSGFSSYVAGTETQTSSGGSTSGGSGSSGGSASRPSTTPVTPPATEQPSDDPSDEPSDVPGSDIPDIPQVDPTEPESPAPVAGMILGALAAAAVLRRK